MAPKELVGCCFVFFFLQFCTFPSEKERKNGDSNESNIKYPWTGGIYEYIQLTIGPFHGFGIRIALNNEQIFKLDIQIETIERYKFVAVVVSR